MVRVASTALFVNFGIGATSKPTTVQVTALIKTFYQQSYESFYGVGKYNDTDDATSDPNTLIRSDEFVGILTVTLSKQVQQWHDSGMSSSGEVIPMPDFLLPGKIDKKFKAMFKHATKGTRIASIRIYGSEIDDMGVI